VPDQKGQHHANQAGDDSGREESEMDRGDPNGQIGQIACLVRIGEREHAGDIGPDGNEATWPSEKTPVKPLANPMEDDQQALMHMTVTTRTR